MKVKELIELLKNVDPEANIFVDDKYLNINSLTEMFYFPHKNRINCGGIGTQEDLDKVIKNREAELKLYENDKNSTNYKNRLSVIKMIKDEGLRPIVNLTYKKIN